MELISKDLCSSTCCLMYLGREDIWNIMGTTTWTITNQSEHKSPPEQIVKPPAGTPLLHWVLVRSDRSRCEHCEPN